MPIRLLFYMTEIWRDVLKNVSNKERRRKEDYDDCHLSNYIADKDGKSIAGKFNEYFKF